MKHKGSRRKKKYRVIALGDNGWGKIIRHTTAGAFGKKKEEIDEAKEKH